MRLNVGGNVFKISIFESAKSIIASIDRLRDTNYEI